MRLIIVIVFLCASPASLAQFRGFEFDAVGKLGNPAEFMTIAGAMRERAEDTREQARQLDQNGQHEAAEDKRYDAETADMAADRMVQGAAAAAAGK